MRDRSLPKSIGFSIVVVRFIEHWLREFIVILAIIMSSIYIGNQDKLTTFKGFETEAKILLGLLSSALIPLIVNKAKEDKNIALTQQAFSVLHASIFDLMKFRRRIIDFHEEIFENASEESLPLKISQTIPVFSGTSLLDLAKSPQTTTILATNFKPLAHFIADYDELKCLHKQWLDNVQGILIGNPHVFGELIESVSSMELILNEIVTSRGQPSAERILVERSKRRFLQPRQNKDDSFLLRRFHDTSVEIVVNLSQLINNVLRTLIKSEKHAEEIDDLMKELNEKYFLGLVTSALEYQWARYIGHRIAQENKKIEDEKIGNNSTDDYEEAG